MDFTFFRSSRRSKIYRWKNFDWVFSFIYCWLLGMEIRSPCDIQSFHYSNGFYFVFCLAIFLSILSFGITKKFYFTNEKEQNTQTTDDNNTNNKRSQTKTKQKEQADEISFLFSVLLFFFFFFF